MMSQSVDHGYRVDLSLREETGDRGWTVLTTQPRFDLETERR
jgi:hypothetical protein